MRTEVPASHLSDGKKKMKEKGKKQEKECFKGPDKSEQNVISK